MQEPGVSATSTEDSRASRPRRGVHRFDYNVLNGTSGNLGALLQAGDSATPTYNLLGSWSTRRHLLDQTIL